MAFLIDGIKPNGNLSLDMSYSECFLPKKLSDILERDKEFRKVLFEVFTLEEYVLDQSVSIVFNDFINHYTKVKEN